MATQNPVSNEAGDAGAAIEAWRARGQDRMDPVHFRFIEALARRTQAQRGEARRILDHRLARLLAAYRARLEDAGAQGTGTTRAEPVKKDDPAHRGALAELLEHVAHLVPAHEDAGAAGDGVPRLAPSAELKTLSYFRSTWSRLSADRWLTQSLAKMPENAGPLHSHHLVHRSLTLMRQLSPEYLNRFMAYVDGLSWVEQLHAGSATHAAAARAEGGRKGGRGKSA